MMLLTFLAQLAHDLNRGHVRPVGPLSIVRYSRQTDGTYLEEIVR